MDEKKNGVHAPYNFVPFSNKVQLPYETEADLPRHDRFDPQRETGEIHITLTAETPVFVSNGDRKNPHFFRGANGNFMIPGSTIRGMVRENMQILGFGLVKAGEDLEDYQIYFRKVAAPKGSNAGPLNKYYQTVLGVKTKRTDEGKTYSIPERVQSGYILREGTEYRIYPTKTPYLRVSRKHPDIRKFQCGIKKQDNAKAVPILYQESGGRVKKILPAEKGGQSGMQSGFLLFTGQSVGNRENHLYLFPEADWQSPPVTLTKEDELSYQEDWEKREKSLGAYYDASFWKLPEEGEDAKPVFYLSYEGHVYCGMSLFLRIGYRFPLSHGLPDRHKRLAAEQSPKLDYVQGMLGFAEADRSYRSRISFGDFSVEPSAKEMSEVHMILGEPKPSYYPGYVEPGGKEFRRAVHYNEDGFKLRGYKQYWLKNPEQTSVPEGKEKVGATLRPLPQGTKFQGVIRYQNLSGAELGLLLWALRLDKGCYQSVGMGKPYGYGRMRLDIDGLVEYDLKNLYGGTLFPEEQKQKGYQLDNIIESYINAYDNAASLTLNLKGKQRLRDRREIKDFLFLKQTIQSGEEFSYMVLDAYKNTTVPLPTVQAFREKTEHNDKPQYHAEKPQDAMKLAALWKKQLETSNTMGNQSSGSKKRKRRK